MYLHAVTEVCNLHALRATGCCSKFAAAPTIVLSLATSLLLQAVQLPMLKVSSDAGQLRDLGPGLQESSASLGHLLLLWQLHIRPRSGPSWARL